MAITLVQATGTTTFVSAATTTLAFGSNNTAGNVLVASAFDNDGTGVGTFSDSQGNTWHTSVKPGPAGISSGYLGYVLNCKPGANTVTFTTNNGVIACGIGNIGEFSGVGTTASTVMATNGSHVAAASLPITVATAAAIVNGWSWDGSVPVNTAPFASVNSYSTGNGFNGLAYDIATPGTYTSAATGLSANTWTSLITSFPAAAAGGGSTGSWTQHHHNFANKRTSR